MPLMNCPHVLMSVHRTFAHCQVIISRDGIVSALVLWFDLILDEEIVASTSPFGEPDRTLALGQGICYLQPSECRVKRGATVPFVAATNGSELAFTINDVVLLMKVRNTEALARNNIAVATFEGGSFIACGLILRGTLTGGSDYTLAEGMLLTVIYWLLSQLLLLPSHVSSLQVSSCVLLARVLLLSGHIFLLPSPTSSLPVSSS